MEGHKYDITNHSAYHYGTSVCGITLKERVTMDWNKTVQDALNGSAEAWGLLFEKTQSMVYFTCVKLIHDAEAAQDIAQEVYIAAMKSLDTLSDPMAFPAWIKRIAVKHGKEELRQELYVMVDNGAKVLDVLVEHTVYGVISGQLNLATRYDVDTFVSKVETTGASPLSTLTEGLHVHTLSVPDEQSFARIVDCLTKLGVFIDSD